MVPLVIQHVGLAVRIPQGISDHASFRRWATSDDFPERGWYSFLAGELWVDPSSDRHAQNQVKAEVHAVLGTAVKKVKAGVFLGSRMLLTHVAAQLSTEPDGMFVSYEALGEGRARLAQGEDSVEVEGTPDMVLEIVSPSSLERDTKVLRDLYWRAGVPEYWLIDPRGKQLTFDILKHDSEGYVPTRERAGWLKSRIFGESFRLTQRDDPFGLSAYDLQVQ